MVNHLVHTRYDKRFFSVFLSFLVIISTVSFVLTPVAAQVPGFPDTYTVSWAKSSPSTSHEWTGGQSEWLFGPKIEFDITYLNGTSLASRTRAIPSHFLMLEQPFLVTITVPKSMITPGRNASYISLTLSHSEQVTEPSPHTAWECSLFFGYLAYPARNRDPPVNPPLIRGDGWIINSTLAEFEQDAPPDITEGLPLIIPNFEECEFIETSDNYVVRIQASLNPIFDLAGTYEIYSVVYDTKGMSLGESDIRGHIVLLEPTMEGIGTLSPFIAYLTDMDDQSTPSILPGTDVKIHIDMGSFENYDNVTIFIHPPVDYGWWDNLSLNTQDIDYKKEMIITEGYYRNQTSETWQTGPHPAYSPYGPSLADSRPTRAVKLTYDIEANEFDICEGYYYWVFNSQTLSENFSARLSIELQGESNFYVLNEAMSKVVDGTNIEFVLKIPFLANCSVGNYQFEAVAYTSEGEDVYEMHNYGSTYWIRVWDKGFSVPSLNTVTSVIMKNMMDSSSRWILPGRYYSPIINITGDDAFRNAIRSRITNVTILLEKPRTWQNWHDEDFYYNMASRFRIYLIHNSIEDTTFIEAYNSTILYRIDLETYEETYTYLNEKINASEFAGLGDNQFSVQDDSIAHTLVLAYNLTLKETVPNGLYNWEVLFFNESLSLEYEFDYETVYPNSQRVLIGYVSDYSDMYATEQRWMTDPITRALDLDGNNATTSDRYYVNHIYTSSNSFTTTGEILTVNVTWGSYSMTSVFGEMSYTWHHEWEDLYVWMYAENKSVVSPQVFDKINRTIWDTDGVVIPEYYQLAGLTSNHTWADTVAENSAYDWWSEDRTFKWLVVSFIEDFYTEVNGEYSGVDLSLFFSGILLFEDLNEDGILNVNFEDGIAVAEELTHFFILEETESLVFMTPEPSDSGEIQLALDDTPSWGFTAEGINGTTYPASASGGEVSGVAWWWQDCYGIQSPSGNFTQVPSKVRIDDMSFISHFGISDEVQGDVTTQDLGMVRIKVDESVGDWSIYGQPLSALFNYSLALTFQTTTGLETHTMTTYEGAQISDDATSFKADRFSLSANIPGSSPFATMQMGGYDYTWGKDDGIYTMHSSTVPLSAFALMYSTSEMTDDDTMTVSSCTYIGTYYIMTSCFENWDGYSVATDPQFNVFVVAPPGGLPWSLIFGGAALAIGLPVVGIIVCRRRQYEATTTSA